MHAVPFIPTISFKLAERGRFYVDAERFTRIPHFRFPRVIIQIRKLLVASLAFVLQIHFVSAPVQLKLKTTVRLTEWSIRTGKYCISSCSIFLV